MGRGVDPGSHEHEQLEHEQLEKPPDREVNTFESPQIHCVRLVRSSGKTRGGFTEVATDVVHIIYVPSSMGSTLYQNLDKYYITGTVKVP